MSNRPFYHYHYWSKRQTRQLAEELGMDFRPRWRVGASGGLPFLKVQANQLDYSPRIDEVAVRLEGSGVLLDFEATGNRVRPPYFMRGFAPNVEMLVSLRRKVRVEFGAAAYISLLEPNYDQTLLCLFGSQRNFFGFEDQSNAAGTDGYPTTESGLTKIHGFVTSSQFGIAERLHLISKRSDAQDSDEISVDTANPRFDDLATDNIVIPRLDEEQLLSAIRWMRSDSKSPYTRHIFSGVEWCAQVYTCILPTASSSRENWGWRTKRILIGAPLWIRTALPTVKTSTKR
jgi:hypothetical protein